MQDAPPITRLFKSNLGKLMLRLNVGDWYKLTDDEWRLAYVAKHMGLTVYIEPPRPPDGSTFEQCFAWQKAHRGERDYYKLTPIGLAIVSGNKEQRLRAGKYRLPGEKAWYQKAGDWVLQAVSKLPSPVQVKAG